MTTEKDNLQKADGENSENVKPEIQNPSENQTIESAENSENQTETVQENENVENQSSIENTTAEEKVETENVSESKDFDESADNDQAESEDHEEENEAESHEVPQKDYDEMSFFQLVEEAKDLLKNFSPLMLKEAFGHLRDATRKIMHDEESELKEKFLAEGGNEIDFKYDHPLRQNFNAVYAEYRARLDAEMKEREKRQKANLVERQSIIDDLKALYTEPSTNNSQIFKKFRELKTRWHNAGRIPRTEANNIFRTYYFHLDNFNEFLDLNQELRKMDYEHNLEVRNSIIARTKELLAEENVQKALNELQYLHRMWKEEAVPVAEELREPTWQEFKELTAKIHDRKVELNEQLQLEQQQNLEKKREIISKISNLISGDEITKHNVWQKKIKEMKTLREAFFGMGRVPREFNQTVWNEFKEVSRNFNHHKNDFYKTLKSEQMENLEKKRKLVEIAREHENSSDWDNSVNVVKRIQSDWKKIGHVPRKFSDKIWNEFHEANNKFFDRYKNRNNAKLQEQEDNLMKKEALIAEMKSQTPPTDHKKLLDWLNDYSLKWGRIGFVPQGKLSVNKEFNKAKEEILVKSGLSKDAIEKAQWDNQILTIRKEKDDRALSNLKYDLRKQIDSAQKEVTHLQTNLAFFSNPDETNPLFKNAIGNIESKVAELSNLESKYNDLRRINLDEDFLDELEAPLAGEEE